MPYVHIGARPNGRVRPDVYEICQGCHVARRYPNQFRTGYPKCDRCFHADKIAALAAIAAAGGSK